MSVEFVPQEMLIIRLEDDWPLRRNRLQTPTQGGSSSVAERQLPKLNVAGSIPVSRSKKINDLRNLVSFVLLLCSNQSQTSLSSLPTE
jgi:hypothetical protein